MREEFHMKAGLITGVRKFELCEVPEPQLIPGSAIVDITLCGICGSDVTAYKYGEEMGIVYPKALCGHEWTGVVRHTAPDVTAVSEGDRVILGSTPPCGMRCAACRQGRYHACETVAIAMLGGDGFSPNSGGFAPRQTVDATRLVRIPDKISDAQAAMAEPATVAAHGVRKSSPLPGDRVAVLGAGPIGLFALQLLKASGAGQVIVIEPVQHRREKALQLGADFAWAPSKEASESIADITNGLGLDRVYDCAGAAASLESAVKLVRRQGTVMMIGFSSSQIPADVGMWLLKEIEIRTSYAFDKADTQAVLDLMARGSLDAPAMHSGTVSLEETEAVFAELAGDSEKVKVLVDPRR
jgi:(R,R)-butanediol dehydrogenase/meso-butanediol dehydrogenase/diacetyl reductase